MRNINLYGDDGISIMLDRYDDITADRAEAVVEITGHSVYFCSLEEAHAFIRAEYLITGHSVYFCSLKEAHASIRAEYLDNPLFWGEERKKRLQMVEEFLASCETGESQ